MSRWMIVAVAVALPAAGFVLLLARPEIDLAWQNHRAHFWLVLSAAAITAALVIAVPVGLILASAIAAATLRELDGATTRPLGAIEVKGRRPPLDAYVLEALASG